MNISALFSLVRGLLIAIGGSAAGDGLATDSEIQAAIGGLITFLTIAWGVWDKLKKDKKPDPIPEKPSA